MKSIYEKALELLVKIQGRLSTDYDKFLEVKQALEKAQKQEKLLEHYKDLAEVRKLLYKLTTNFKQSNKDRITILLTQEKLISDIIEELENGE